MEIAPTRPRTRVKPSQETVEGMQRQRGVALLMVLFLLVMSTIITLDLQFDARVQLQLAANSRNNLQAEYLARSAVQFTHLLLSFNTNFLRMKTQFKKFAKMAPPPVQVLLNRLQLWKVIPIDCGMLKQLFGGAFGNKQTKKDDDTPPQQGANGKEGKLYPFGEFQGNCKAQLSDESAKINLNRFANYNDATVLTRHLANLFASKRYDPLFEKPRADGTQLTRQEQVSAIQDWVDSNTQVAGETGTSEDSKYRYQEKGYINKNSYFDSIQELRLVYGVDDVFYREFSKFFTVYGRTTININGADPEVLRMLIMSYGKPEPPATPAVFLQPEFQQFMATLESYRSFLGFDDANHFVRWAKNPVAIDPQIAGGVPATGSQQIQGNLPRFNINFGRDAYKFKTNADTFRVEAMGIVGTVRRRIEAVIYVTDRGARVTQYWRIY